MMCNNVLSDARRLEELGIPLQAWRGDVLFFREDTNTDLIQRAFEELVGYLFRELTLPSGVLLMTETGIVPPEDFTLQVDDQIAARIGQLSQERVVTR